MLSIYTITVKTNRPNSCHYQNANRFVKSIVIKGSEALWNKVQELRSKGVEIISVRDYTGNKVEI